MAECACTHLSDFSYVMDTMLNIVPQAVPKIVQPWEQYYGLLVRVGSKFSPFSSRCLSNRLLYRLWVWQVGLLGAYLLFLLSLATTASFKRKHNWEYMLRLPNTR